MKGIEIPATLLIDPEQIVALLRGAIPGATPIQPDTASAPKPDPTVRAPLRLKITEGAPAEVQGRQVIEQTLQQAHGISAAWTEMDTQAVRFLRTLFSSVSLNALASTVAGMPQEQVTQPVSTWLHDAFKLAAMAGATPPLPPSAGPYEAPPAAAQPPSHTKKRGRPKKVKVEAAAEAPPLDPTLCSVCGSVLPSHAGNCPGNVRALPREVGEGGAIPPRVPTSQAPPRPPSQPSTSAPGGPGFEVCRKGGQGCPLPHRPVIFNGSRVAGHALSDLALLRAEMGMEPGEPQITGVAPRMEMPAPPSATRARGKKKGRARR